MGRTKPLVTDELWDVVAPLLAAEAPDAAARGAERGPDAGSKRVSSGLAQSGVVYAAVILEVLGQVVFGVSPPAGARDPDLAPPEGALRRAVNTHTS